MMAFERSGKRNRTGQLSEAGPPETGVADGAHGREDSIGRIGCQGALPGICFITVKFEIGGHHAAETPQPFQPFLPLDFLCRIECRPDAGDLDIDVITFFQIEGFDNCRGQPDSEAVSPFENLHDTLRIRTFHIKYDRKIQLDVS
jgi:hypothetical protein